MNIIQDFIPTGKKCRPGRAMQPKYITVHNTGNRNKGANARGHANFLKGSTGSTGWHFTVDEKEAIQHIPTNEIAYHAGDGAWGKGNSSSIGIEICMNVDGDFDKAVTNAIELIAYLMKELNIPIENVVPHKHWTGKNCPELILPWWDKFIERIREIQKPVADFSKVPGYALPTIKKLVAKGVLNDPNGDESFYRILVVLDRLNIF